MCIVDKKTIIHVNSRMISHTKAHSIPAQSVKDGHIVVPVHLLGSRQYRMSIDRVNELYGKARQKVIGTRGHK